MPSYVLNEDKMFSDVADGIAIVINSENGIYYGFNSFGTIIYENLLRGVPSEAIMDDLKIRPDAPADIAEQFNKFLSSIVGYGILMPSDEQNETPEIDYLVALSDNFALSIEEFTDAQELLLADPIHDVKVETGWTPNASSLAEGASTEGHG